MRKRKYTKTGKRKARRKRRFRILGTDRGLMMLCRDARRRWSQYGENRRPRPMLCVECGEDEAQECDHVTPIGPRPRIPHAFGEWLEKMFYGECQWLCKECHLEKTKRGKNEHGG